MNSTTEKYQASDRRKYQQPKGNWAVSDGISYPEQTRNNLESKLIAAKMKAQNPTARAGGHYRNNSWAYEKHLSAQQTGLDPNSQFGEGGDGYSFSKQKNSATLKPQYSDSYSTLGPQLYNHRISYQPGNAYQPNMIAEDIIDESESPMKPNPTVSTRRVSNVHSSIRDMWEIDFDPRNAKAKQQKMQQEVPDQNALLSTGLSGCESTPSNARSTKFSFSKPNEGMILDSSIQQSDLELESLASNEKLHPSKPSAQMDLEIESKAKKSLEAELAEFNPVIDPCGVDNQTIEYLAQREKAYSTDPHYLKTKQPYLSWNMRAILVDWMFEVSMEFTLKRETFHYALNYVDRFLSLYPNIQKQELQLVGVVALFTAAKNEEIFSFRVDDFAKSCDGAYSTEQIVQTETVLLKTLKWMLVPPTLNTWTQWYLSQWDLYIEKSSYALNHKLAAMLGKNFFLQFRQPTENSYILFREFMQYIDCMVLEAEHLQYNKRTLIAGLMYLVLGKHYGQFTVKQITEQFNTGSQFLLDKTNLYNDLFADFLAYIFGFKMEELLPSIQYAAPFFLLPLNFDMPRAAQIKGGSMLDVIN